jgi:two-component system, OmpR family, response regulator
MDKDGIMARGATRTILAVDDSRTNLNVLGARLGRAGYLVLLSDTGGEALDLIAAGGIDLVLLDLVMPGVSGVQVLHEVRGARETMDLPVIMITGRSEPAAAVEALAAGADDWIAKPFAFEVLEARIAQRAIELGEARADLASTKADRVRLIASIQALHDEIARIETR